nr:zinc finger CCCH domain-containing protein 5 [Tanacetum cinerariifolium]
MFVTQRRLEDKQPEEKTNTDCLVKEQEKEYQTRWKIKTGNVLDSCNQRSIQQYKKSGVAKHLGFAGIQQQNGLVDETNVTFFAKLASIKKRMLEPVKVKCIFLVYHKNIVGNKLWRLDDVTSKVVLYRNMGFNESEEYKNTFIGSGVATVAGNAVTTAMAINGSIHQATKGLLDKAKGNILGMEISEIGVARLRGCHSLGFTTESWYKLLFEGHFILLLEGSLLGDCDVEKNDIRTVFVDFDYAMGRSITRYGFMILRCAGSLKANLQHMEALSTTEAGYMTFTEAWKKKMWLKGLLTESRYELRLVAGIATGALVKGGSRSEVPAQVEVCRNGSFHLRGNVYVDYKSLDSAVMDYNSLQGRYFAGKQVKCEFVSLTRWKVTICGEYMKSRLKTCSRGSACNFLHCFSNPGGDYEWADSDKPPPRYWAKKMTALFGYSDDPWHDKQIDQPSPKDQRHSSRVFTSDRERFV